MANLRDTIRVQQGIDFLGVDSDSRVDFSAVRNVKTHKFRAFIECHRDVYKLEASENLPF